MKQKKNSDNKQAETYINNSDRNMDFRFSLSTGLIFVHAINSLLTF